MKNDTFTQKVYKIVARIPIGQVLTYKQVAERAGRSTAYRAVGIFLTKITIRAFPVIAWSDQTAELVDTIAGLKGRSIYYVEKA